MAQINSTIAGRQFRLACEDGQEEHLQELAKDIDQRIISLRRKFGEIGDTRLTVMAALMVADELAETVQKMRLPRGRHRLLAGCAARCIRSRQGRIRCRDRCIQFRSRTHRGHHPKAQSDGRQRRQRADRLIVFHQVACAPHNDYIERAGLRGASGDTIPGALSILKGAVPGRARGFGHMAPTYFRREPGIDAPTAIAAPHSIAMTKIADTDSPKARLREQALALRDALPAPSAPPPRRRLPLARFQ